MMPFKGELLSEGPSNITVLPCARLSNSKDRRCENKVWLDLETEGGGGERRKELSFPPALSQYVTIFDPVTGHL